ncbi:MAG TPA: sigma factor-like helix-turn-helix DNA-binding protein, partial [Hyphomicrobium sp.]|nr:sigma factor-like helix-turn-helix DNA-binding protein [Hyphomicrobium sp.]
LAELPEKTRRAFELHRLGEHTLAEVGEKIGLSTARTWALVHEAYRHLCCATAAFSATEKSDTPIVLALGKAGARVSRKRGDRMHGGK